MNDEYELKRRVEAQYVIPQYDPLGGGHVPGGMSSGRDDATGGLGEIVARTESRILQAIDVIDEIERRLFSHPPRQVGRVGVDSAPETQPMVPITLRARRASDAADGLVERLHGIIKQL